MSDETTAINAALSHQKTANVTDISDLIVAHAGSTRSRSKDVETATAAVLKSKMRQTKQYYHLEAIIHELNYF